jgi:TolB-like protein/class 3 adenylate cyclase/Tfp pilus assembly protein PilF
MSDSPGKAVFLSYASQDAEAARRICDSLRAGGVEVWFDADGGLEHGDEWDQKIRRQIKECVFFVPVISTNTQARLEGYFRIEWDLAAERARGVAAGVPFILPVVIDDTREPDALVPDRFRKVQWTRLPEGVVSPDVLARLLKLWSHRVGVLAHEDGRARSSGYAPPASSWLAPGETRAPGLGNPAEGATAFGGRRLAAIVFTDVVGYSARMQTDEASTLALVQSDFEQMRRQCAQHSGQVLKSTGDGLLLCFDSVIDAVTCAVAIQTGFAGRGGGALQHRIGVHLGDVYHQAGDVAGDGVNLAARLQTAAQPGTICVSDSVFAAVKGKVAMESLALAPLVLKNIAQPLPAHLIAAVGTRLAAGGGARGARKRHGLVLAGIGVAALAVAAAFFYNSRARTPAPPAAMTVTNRAAPVAEFPRDPDLKRVYKLLYNVVDGIAEDFALMDDLVKPLLMARPNDPEVVTVAAELAQEFITRGFDASPARRADAKRLTERAVQLAPDNPEALAALGYYLYSTDTQLGRAEASLQRAIVLNPAQPRFHCFLYQVLTVSGKPEAELDAFGAHMAAAFPDYPMVPFMIASHHMRIGNLAVAEEWFDKTLAIAPVPYAIISKAKLMLEVHGDVAGMKHWLERMPERQRTSARLLNMYAELAAITGDPNDIKSARRVIDSTTDTWLTDGSYLFPKALLVGELDQIEGKNDLARLQYEAALKEVRSKQAADPTDLRPHRAELWLQLGLGHREEARAALRINVQLRPRPYRWTMSLTWWTSSLRACLLLDERVEALTELREACADAQGRLLLRNLFRVDPKMAPFRDDPEIVALLAEPKKETAASPGPTVDAKSAPADKSVAVLAFANLSGDKENEYFSDGISEDLLNLLGKVPGLRVAARASAFSFKGKDATAQEMGQKLNVAYLVDGSVQRSGLNVRVVSRLSRAATGEQIWSEKFDGDLKNIFALQDEIAAKIAEMLKLKLGTSTHPARSVNPEAYRLYLLGRHQWEMNTEAGTNRAVQCFDQAIQLDPTFALAHCGLADTYNYFGGFTMPGREAWTKEITQAQKALALDANLADAHVSLGIGLINALRLHDAELTYQRAMELNPNLSLIYDGLGYIRLISGRCDEAVAESRKSVALDPLSEWMNGELCLFLYSARRYDEARAQARRALELHPGSLWAYQTLGGVALAQGHAAEAIENFQAAVKIDPSPSNQGDLGYAYAATGQRAAAEKILNQMQALAKQQYVTPSVWLKIHLGLGDVETAFSWLEKCSEVQDPACWYINSDPRYDRLRKDPRCRPLMIKAGLTDEQLK